MAVAIPVPASSPVPSGAIPAPPAAVPAGPVVPALATPVPSMSLGGLTSVKSLEETLRLQDQQNAAAFAQQQSQPYITSLANHIKTCFRRSDDARRSARVDEEMIEALLARRGEYTAAKEQQIQENRQPMIYMMLAAAKMRQIEALLRDVLLGTGTEKPWTIAPTPNPTLPPELVQEVGMNLQQEIQQVLAMGVIPSMEEVRQRLRLMREQLDARVLEEAKIRCERMEHKMEDQLVEGGFMDGLDQFITDLATFKTAFLKGPVIRRKPKLSWGPGGEMIVEDTLVKEWERVDPFNMFPAPYARNIQDGWLIEKHSLTRESLTQLIGVEGYNEVAIREALKKYGDQGLYEPLPIDSVKADAEGKSQDEKRQSGLIDAYQYWGTASGKILKDWGLKVDQVPDEAKEYHIEAWLIGDIVIKAVMNADPLARRPYYATSFQKVPGSVWGCSPYDLIKDCQDMCNGAARALAANMGISSGPQVGILSDRLPSGDDITEMYPWKIWQFQSDPMGGSAKPIEFFQPASNANELMGVYEKFSLLADEYTGIPRYMAGFNGGEGGAGRTASGISMMIGNASKTIKQVLGAIDMDVITKVLHSLYYYNMRYEDDQDLKGDVQILARGALSLTAKEAAAVRTNEFLAATANPIDMQIIGMEGRAELLRQAAKRLDMSPDKVVPPVPVLKERAAMAQMAQAQQQQQQQADGAKQDARDQEMHDAKVQNTQAKTKGEQLKNGAPTTDNFSPSPA